MEHSNIDYNRFNKAIIEQLTVEYQSLWLVDARDLSMVVYKQNTQTAIPGSIETAKEMDYDTARKWYIDHYVTEADRERVLERTSVGYICERLCNNIPLVVDYQRVNCEWVNYNQLYFALVEKEDEEVTFFLLGFRSVDRNRKAELDDLTGLFTRRAFIRRAERLVASAPDGYYDMVLSDIVDFKQINEKYGNKKGDEILKWIGDTFDTPQNDRRLVGRYAGDQFVVLMKHEDAEIVIAGEKDKLLFTYPEDTPPLQVKFGVFRSLNKKTSITTACDCAHVALNSIKHTYGEIVAVYDERLRNNLEIIRIIEANMHQALEEEQFKVYYQPKHDAKTGEVVGAEALIRWIHPEYGFMSPGEFIPLFERNGFVKETDRYVLRRTCENIKRWTDMGLKKVPISVNASKLDIQVPDVVERINAVADDAGIEHSQIHIEITESLMENDEGSIIDKLSKLRECGFAIELDDFGSGYASINSLSAFPIDVVKLDMSFVRQIEDDKRKKVLVACINLGHDLGYETVSEGVETAEQLEILKNMGIDIIQGYYYSKPLPEAEFEEYLRRQSHE